MWVVNGLAAIVVVSLFLSMISQPPPSRGPVKERNRNVTRRLALLLAVLACGVPLRAQTWDALRALKAGDRVVVVDRTGKQHKGAFRAVSDSAITVETGKAEAALDRAEVKRIRVQSGERRLRNALIGVAVGVALGVTVDQTLGARLRNESDGSGRGVTYAAPIALLGGIGAARPAYRTVYQVK